MTSKNTITLSEALQTVIMNGFSGPSPNIDDPIFIQFRIKSHNPLIYNMIGMAVNNYLVSKLYVGTVNGSTPLSSIMRKVVLIIDSQICPNYKSSEFYPKCNSTKDIGCYNLSKYVNMESGTGTLRKYSYSNLMNQVTTPATVLDSNKFETDITLFRLIEPGSENKNPNSIDFIKNYSVQFITNSFNIKDKNLDDYEKMFFENKSAFIPFSIALRQLSVFYPNLGCLLIPFSINVSHLCFQINISNLFSLNLGCLSIPFPINESHFC